MAILEFDSLTDDARNTRKGRMVSEMFVTAAVKCGLFSVVERDKIRGILDEMEFGESGRTFGSVAQKVGSLAGADAVLVGTVSEYRGQVRIDARLISVRQGSVITADNVYSRSDLQSLGGAAENLLRQLVASIGHNGGEQQAAPSAPAQPTPPATAEPKPSKPAGAEILGAESVELRFFEGDRVAPSREARTYAKRFASAQTRYIYWELRVSFASPTGEEALHALRAVYTRADGTVLHEQSKQGRVDAGVIEAFIHAGCGREKPGAWKPGTYRLNVLLEGKPVASGEFTVR